MVGWSVTDAECELALEDVRWRYLSEGVARRPRSRPAGPCPAPNGDHRPVTSQRPAKGTRIRRSVLVTLDFDFEAPAAPDGEVVRLEPPKLQEDDLIVYRYLIEPRDRRFSIVVQDDGGFLFDGPGRVRRSGERDFRFACLTPQEQRRLRAHSRRAGRIGGTARGRPLRGFTAQAMSYRSRDETPRVIADHGRRRALRVAVRRLIRKLHKLQRKHFPESASLSGPRSPPGSYACRPPE